MLKRVFIAAALTLLAGAAACSRPTPEMVRGEVVSLDGSKLAVKNGDATKTVTLAPTWSVSTLKPIEISAIQPGSFIGSANMPKADGSGESLEVHVFPPGVKLGEGHYGWDSQPGAMMTNGTVNSVVVAPAGGRSLEVQYGDAKRKIDVPPGVPVLQITDGERSAVQPGVPVFIVAMNSPAGLVAQSVTVGENGAAPPM